MNQREVDRLRKIADRINSFDKSAQKLKDKDFVKKTEDFKKRLEKGETLDQLLPEAFAVAREAAHRAIGLRPYDVQLMASAALFEGKVAEQKTGEGKTLAAVPALYLRALAGKGAHLVTVNDYLARRDAGWNAPIFHMLGMSVGVIVQEGKSFVYDPKFTDSSHGDERLAHLKPGERKAAYQTDITYGTNNEFGFDYLRDNMVPSLDAMVQRGHYFAIVDEVDSVLIDEARTPLIISAPDTEPTRKYYDFANLITKLNPDTDYEIDEKLRSATLTEVGIRRIEKLLGVDNLYEKDFDTIHHVENALRAKTLYLRDRDYVVKDDQVTIVDENTGRLMFGRRWSDGMHQAVEAKEGVAIQQETKTLATISFQNYFRMYEFLAGMTGTAATEAEEFRKIYKLEVVVIPTHRDMVRKDHSDVIYKSVSAKYGAVVSEINERRLKGQPILVGTTSIEKNEIVGQYLRRKKIPHNVLNAKNHEREAMIIAEAGKPGAVTVATNMAGRGVDVVLGGAPPDKPEGVAREKFQKTKKYQDWQKAHDKVVKAGGLHVLGTERHQSRRIDNQLRGRSGRQGDPGSSRFYLSLEDDLMRIFGGEQIRSLMDRMKLPDDQPIENRLVNRAIEQAQVKVEGFNFDARKNVVEYDDVVNQQRQIVYGLRRRILESKDVKEEVSQKLKEQISLLVSYASSMNERIDIEKIIIGMLEIVPFDDASKEQVKKQIANIKDKEKLENALGGILEEVHKARENQVGSDSMRQIEKFAYLGAIDHLWMDHIDQIDALREGVRLRTYAQKDPVAEFKNEAFDMFEELMQKIDGELSKRIFRIQVVRPQTEIPLERARTNIDTGDQTGLMDTPTPELGTEGGPKAFAQPPTNSTQEIVNSGQPKTKKIGRNDPCWCGSGKKWKKCHYPQLG